MSRTVRIAAICGWMAVATVAVGPPAGAIAEQASQPAAPAAGRLDVGRYHACGVLSDASVRCWGYGGDGALGYAGTSSVGDDESPGAAGPVDLGAGRTATALSAGAVHTCALLDGGAVRCWGFGGNGRLGYAATDAVGDDDPPGAAGPVDLGDGRTAKAITAGRAHTCAILDDGTVRCWGFGFDGRLGYGTTDSVGDNEAPGSVGPVRLGDGRTATAITAGESHTCALLDDRTVRCWGFGSNGALGYGSTDAVGDNETPDAAGPVRLGGPAVAVTAGAFHTCALLDDGTVRCWGFGGNGRLGYANTQSIGDDESPAAAGPVALGRPAVAISAGNDHTCALLDDGTVRCWGLGANGRLGYASTNSIGDDEAPGSVGPVDLGADRRGSAVSAGGASTCARLDDQSVRCWGTGANGILGSCSTNSIGDDEVPGAAGPVELGAPGSPGAGCAGVPAAPPPASGVAAPGPAPPPSPSGLRPAAPRDGAQLAQTARAVALRACVRRTARRSRRGRRSCLERYGRTPGRVTTLRVKAVGARRVALRFRAVGTDGSRAPVARRYVVKQSRRPIRGAGDFARARALCKGACSFDVAAIGASVVLDVTDLSRRSAYYYSVAARDNVSARIGRRSATVRARTR